MKKSYGAHMLTAETPPPPIQANMFLPGPSLPPLSVCTLLIYPQEISSVRETVNVSCAELKISEFTYGKSQLEQKLVDETCKIAALHIHVGRVIGLFRDKFTILQGIVPIMMIMKT